MASALESTASPSLDSFWKQIHEVHGQRQEIPLCSIMLTSMYSIRVGVCTNSVVWATGIISSFLFPSLCTLTSRQPLITSHSSVLIVFQINSHSVSFPQLFARLIKTSFQIQVTRWLSSVKLFALQLYQVTL